jgi:hypothetical protein
VYSKGYIQETYNQYCSKWGKTETIVSKIRNEKRILSLPLFSIVLGFLARAISLEDKIKGIQIR